MVLSEKPFRVLSLDGGGMRGTYTATYLDRFAKGFASRRASGPLDVGRAFDLITGTSTGGVIACAVAAGVPLTDVVEVYQEHGPGIFRRQLPVRAGLGLIVDILRRPAALAAGTETLRSALVARFKDETLAQLYSRRKIGLAISAVELSQHRSWVFKTPHLPNTTNHRDDNYRLVDVCLATTAAPVYRSLAAIDHPDGNGNTQGHNVFVDGGLWANNPVLIGLIDALEMAAPAQMIQIFCLGTCPRPVGERIDKAAVNRGLPEWAFGGEAAGLAIDVQEFGYDNMARLLAPHLDRKCEIVRFPRGQIPASLIPYLGLDDTRSEAISALINQARADADMANSCCADPNSRDGRLLAGLFMDAPLKPP